MNFKKVLIYEILIFNKNQLMAQFKVKGRYVDRQRRSHYFELISDSADRSFIKDLVRAKYPAVDIFISTVNQNL